MPYEELKSLEVRHFELYERVRGIEDNLASNMISRSELSELMRLFHCGASSKDAGKRITTGCHLQVAAVDVLGRIKIALLPCIVRDVIELEVVDKTLMTWVSRYVR